MALSENYKSAPVAGSSHAMTGLTLAATMLILGWVLKYSSYGIEFTDEGFHLVSISNPFIYDFSITQFGFVYHPLYVLLGGDIAALRQANILVTFALAGGLAHTLLVAVAPESRANDVVLCAAAAGLATSVFALFDSWLLTPSYYSLALQSLLVTSIGMLMFEPAWNWRSVAGSMLIGAGGWLAFMAKPSTAGALAVGTLVYLIVSKKFQLRLLLLAITSAVVPLLLSAFVIDGSLRKFVERLQLGLEFGQYLGGGHTFTELLRIDSFWLNGKDKLLTQLVFLATFIAVWGFLSRRSVSVIVSLIAAVSLFLVTALLVFGQIPKVAELGQFQGLSFFGVVYAAALAGLAFGRPRPFKGLSVAHWSIACLFLITPHMYAFGTNVNYWESGIQAGFFWLLAGIVLLSPIARERSNWSFLLPLVLAAQAVTATLLQSALEQPFRQPQSLKLNDAPINLGPHRSELILSKAYASYISDAVMAAKNSGFKPGDPVIDLSGQSPTLLYAMGAESIGAAWMIGGYTGSLKYATAVMGRVSCEKLAAAWVLVEATGPRSIPTELMADMGAMFPQNYKHAGTWSTADGAGGYIASRVQELYRPINPADTLKACKALRDKDAE
ncbi:hypothetical protein A6U98_34845 [Rhizobium sp. WYCCWR10014]|uniref:hypothetical protein n=1 Tax=Rhizobium sp. WYCCWR10014 TaxID=1825933 RepID=UPI0007E2F027|nr:hypothetical protein [Rhizobium sp. WYCCWR10014]OAV53955.1 hypothetical protein A6U98_34845 [Rhizobium sp. WYCCWR10014]